MSEKIYVVTEQEAGQRLDQFLKEASGLTRSEVQKWIKDGRALLADGKMIRPNYHVQAGDQISFSWEEKKELALIPQDIPLDILYEDEHMLVINKARGMVVHPGSGNPDGTLVNALLFMSALRFLRPARIPYVRALYTALTRIPRASWSSRSRGKPSLC